MENTLIKHPEFVLSGKKIFLEKRDKNKVLDVTKMDIDHQKKQKRFLLW